MSSNVPEMVRRLYETVSHLALTVDDVRRTAHGEAPALRRLGARERGAWMIMDEASDYLLREGYRWDGRRFVAPPEPTPGTADDGFDSPAATV